MIEIFPSKKFNQENCFLMELSENNQIYGKCQVKLIDKYAYLIEIKLEAEFDLFVMYDGLIRASINKALNNGAVFFIISKEFEKYNYLTKNKFLDINSDFINEDFNYDYKTAKYVEIEELFSRECSGGK